MVFFSTNWTLDADKIRMPSNTNIVIVLTHKPGQKQKPSVRILTAINRTIIFFKERGLLYSAPLYKLCICVIFVSAYIRPQYVGALIITWHVVREDSSIKGSRYPSMTEALQGQEGKIWWNFDNPKQFFFSPVLKSKAQERKQFRSDEDENNLLLSLWASVVIFQWDAPLCSAAGCSASC